MIDSIDNTARACSALSAKDTGPGGKHQLERLVLAHAQVNKEGFVWNVELLPHTSASVLPTAETTQTNAAPNLESQELVVRPRCPQVDDYF